MPDLLALRAGLADLAALVSGKAVGGPAALMSAEMEAARKLYRASQGSKGLLPDMLQWLIDHAVGVIAELMALLADANISAATWEERFAGILARYHLAAFMAGNGSETVTAGQLAAVGPKLQAQLSYLQGFRAVVQDEPEFSAFWNLRAASYATGIKVPYWQGRTKLLPLPAMPTEGTICMGNCKCLWRVDTIDEAANDYDGYWERHVDDSCDTCLQRAEDWAPVLIRGGVLQL